MGRKVLQVFEGCGHIASNINGWRNFVLLFFAIALVLGAMETTMGVEVVHNESFVMVNQPVAKAGHGGGHGGHGETPPENFVVMDLFAELFHFELGGFWVKITELKPKVLHIQELYLKGDKHKAYAKSLGVATEVILLGFFVEHFGIAELFVSAMSFSDFWVPQLGLSLVGVMLSTKAAIVIDEIVEEAVEEKYHKLQQVAKPTTTHH